MDIELYYIEKGSGESLVLLHGNGENSDYFESQIEYFSKAYRVIAVDTRGHGRTPRGEGEFSLWRFADDLKNFFDSHNIAKAHILGFSDGANIALCFVLKYPGYADKLILDGGNLFFDGLTDEIKAEIMSAYKEAKLTGDKKDEEMLALMIYEPDINPADLHSIKSETLILTGTDDVIGDSHTKLIADNIKNSRWIRIEGDHYIAAKKADVFNKTVEEFLTTD